MNPTVVRYRLPCVYREARHSFTLNSDSRRFVDPVGQCAPGPRALFALPPRQRPAGFPA
jgi:hypothetical protein